MALVQWRINPGGIRELEMMIEAGMETAAEVVAERARENIRPHRHSGDTEDSIHLNVEHLDEWPRPIVFVGTASGDGFFVHEGTVDTPYIPFLAEALDSTAGDFPRLIRQGTRQVAGRLRGGDRTRNPLAELNRRFRRDQGIRREG
ncbi:MAG TPA: hypothetical protein VF377_12270 [Acidimicrobiia bacterium]